MPNIPMNIDVTIFRPICSPKDAPIWFMKNISTPPSIELNTNFSIFNMDILKIVPMIIIPIIHDIIMLILFMSKVIPPILYRYVFLWTNILLTYS